MNNNAKQGSNGNQSKLNQKDKKDIKKKPKNEDLEEEDDQEYGDENNDDQWFSDSSTSSNEGEQREPRLVMYAAFTQYDVVKEVGKAVFNYHLTKDDQKDWDIAWFDGAISIKLLQKMWPHQRTNHFPGMYNLARKNCLGRHLMRMQKWFPDDYNYFPQTFMLPTDYKEFKSQITAKRNKTFIVKPEASCQGKGIFLTRSFEDIDPKEHYVVQRYMHKPYLVDGYKFDLRIYVLLAGVNPLRIFVYKEGLSRFATVPYESPAPNNLDNLYMHLTNYAINKDSENFVQNTSAEADDVGSKRSFTFILRQIASEFGQEKSDQVFEDINHLIIKTLCIAQPYLQHLYKSCQPDDIENSLCCQVLGFDVILDHNLVPQLLEVNQSPSFTTDSPLDYKIKKALITDTIKLWNLSIKRKLRAKGNKRAEMQKRLLNYQNQQKDSKKAEEKKVDNKTQDQNKEQQEDDSIKNKAQNQDIDEKQEQKNEQVKQNLMKQMKQLKSPKIEDKKQLQKQQREDEREQQRRKKMLQREKIEKELQGDYVLVYPLVSYEEEFKILEEIEQNKKNNQNEDEKPFISDVWQKQQQYLTFMEKAKQLWESFTQGNVINKKKREQEQKEKEEQEKKEQQKKKQIMFQKLKKEKEERKLKEEQRKAEYEQYLQQQREYFNMMSQGEGGNSELYSENRQMQQESQKSYMQQNQNHFSYRTSSTGAGDSSRNGNAIYPQQESIISRQQQYGGNQYESFSKGEIKEIQGIGIGGIGMQINNRNIKTQHSNNMIPHTDNDQGFYLPQVGSGGYNVKKMVHDDYEKQHQRYNQLIRYYNMGEDSKGALPAVPALQQQTPINYELKQRKNQSNRREIVLIENPQALQKPPLNNSQLIKRDEIDVQKILNGKKQSNAQNVVYQTPKLNEILQIPYPSSTNLNSSNSIQSKFQNQLSIMNPSKLQTEGSLNGISHYTMKPNTYELIRSMSLDRKELPQITNSSTKANSVQVSQSTNRQEINKQNVRKLSPQKKTKSEIFGNNSNKPDDSLVQLGIVGQRKELLTDNAQKVDKRVKQLKLKERPQVQIQSGFGNMNSYNIVNPTELYKLLN